MKSQLRNHVAALFLLAPVAATISALPATALAQPAAPEVQSLEVNSDFGIKPGSRLRLRLEGTPRGQASVRIRGVNSTIALREVEPGVYVGRYVITRNDRVAEGAPIRASLRSGNRTSVASYTVPDGLGGPVAGGPPPAPPQPPAPPVLRIERFAAVPIDRIEPGAELRFTVEAAPGARAWVDLPGIRNDVALNEVRPGVYEGGYTLRRSDALTVNGPVVANLRYGDRVITAQLQQPLVAADNRPPNIVNLSPREGERVMGGPPATVSGNFEDRGGTGVDPATVRVMIDGRNVTGETNVSPDSFSFRGALPPGRHTVDVTARDRAGNTVRRSWSFDVALAGLPIEITSHPNNGVIEGNVAHVRGHTAPFASVQVRVQAVPPVIGQFGVAQQVFADTLQADREGNFEFRFASSIPMPGTRYEVSLVANKADVTREARIVLFQRQG